MKVPSIKKRRILAGMTQQELAKAVGVCQATIVMWESGQTAPNVHRLKDVAKVLGCEVEDLIEC